MSHFHNNREKPFRPSLAATASWQDLQEIVGRGDKLFASTKLDGIRAIVKEGELVSRTLKPIRNRHIQSILARPELEGLDGELIVGLPYGEGVFARSISGVMSGEGQPDFTYYVFDNWVTGKEGLNFEERYKALKVSISQICHLFPQIILLPQTRITDISSLEGLEQDYVEKGYEGVILRWALSPYKLDRSTLKERYMLKLKRFLDSEGKITGFEELMHNENERTTDNRGYTIRSSHKDNMVPGNTLGKIQIQDIHNPNWIPKVGSGFNSATRDEIWQNQDKYLGKIIKYKYLPVGTLEQPRHPIFLGFRHEDDL